MQVNHRHFPQYKQPGAEDAGTECDTLEFDLKVRCSLSAKSLELKLPIAFHLNMPIVPS